jgi:hypothetical protein
MVAVSAASSASETGSVSDGGTAPSGFALTLLSAGCPEDWSFQPVGMPPQAARDITMAMLSRHAVILFIFFIYFLPESRSGCLFVLRSAPSGRSTASDMPLYHSFCVD